MSDEYARVRLEPCPECGQPLTFASKFRKFGQQHVQVCEHCRKLWHNGKCMGAVEVAGQGGSPA